MSIGRTSFPAPNASNETQNPAGNGGASLGGGHRRLSDEISGRPKASQLRLVGRRTCASSLGISHKRTYANPPNGPKSSVSFRVRSESFLLYRSLPFNPEVRVMNLMRTAPPQERRPQCGDRPKLSLVSPILSLAPEVESGGLFGPQAAPWEGLQQKLESRLAAVLDLKGQQSSARVRFQIDRDVSECRAVRPPGRTG